MPDPRGPGGRRCPRSSSTPRPWLSSSSAHPSPITYGGLPRSYERGYRLRRYTRPRPAAPSVPGRLPWVVHGARRSLARPLVPTDDSVDDSPLLAMPPVTLRAHSIAQCDDCGGLGGGLGGPREGPRGAAGKGPGRPVRQAVPMSPGSASVSGTAAVAG